MTIEKILMLMYAQRLTSLTIAMFVSDRGHVLYLKTGVLRCTNKLTRSFPVREILSAWNKISCTSLAFHIHW